MRNPMEHCRCINCGWSLSGTILIDPRQPAAQPSDGDVTVCLYCGHIMCFVICRDRHIMLRNPKDEELYDIAGRQDIVAFQKVRKDFLEDMEKSLKKNQKKNPESKQK